MTAAAALSRRRGQPLVVLAAIAAGWIGLRAATWQQPFAAPPSEPASPVALPAESPAARLVPPRHDAARTAGGSAASGDQPARVGAPRPAPLEAGSHPRSGRDVAPSGLGAGASGFGATSSATDDDKGAGAARDRGGLSHEPSGAHGTPANLSAEAGRRRKRWHFDGWYAWRNGSGQPRVALGGPRPPAYGGTQGGFVLRYDLGGGATRPQLYFRATHAPSRPAQADAAAGVGLRPLARVPIRLQGEARLTRTEGWTEVRPAVAAITEVPPARLALGLRGEAYAQAGFVGGREATGFVDGQVRVDRELASLAGGDLRLGFGAWGGAQKYAARLDVGPGLTLDLREAGLPARLSLDYRVRIAGGARPSNGPAVTLSTGF
ncbi:hypothetical protein N0B51_08520 [Tsuneonella sp. YG55]|uniref:Uncharacterized protein n=1 Tax=Tsuneonella litorea TaxID=2976475 RepID=A0A9X3ALA7_9SPHN|nr:hypothetical protein [Tsuneonella litorea]MCT2559023.1 hypothetical protein [Tsuneonella litorea]